MAAPTKAARLAKELETMREERDSVVRSLNQLNAEYENAVKAKEEIVQRVSKQRDEAVANNNMLTNQLQSVRNELSAAKAELANLQRLNAIQAGYIQRANEDDEFYGSAYKGFSAQRRGPKLDEFEQHGRRLFSDTETVGDISRRREYFR